jgi:hypothetical protein
MLLWEHAIGARESTRLTGNRKNPCRHDGVRVFDDLGLCCYRGFRQASLVVSVMWPSRSAAGVAERIWFKTNTPMGTKSFAKTLNMQFKELQKALLGVPRQI